MANNININSIDTTIKIITENNRSTKYAKSNNCYCSYDDSDSSEDVKDTKKPTNIKPPQPKIPTNPTINKIKLARRKK